MAASASSTELPCSSAPMTTAVIRVSSRLTTKPARPGRDRRLAQRCARRRRSRGLRRSAAVRMSSTSGMSATGLKKCMPTVSAPISVTESEEVFVASTHSGVDDRELGEDLPLHVHLLDHRLQQEVAVREAVIRRRAGRDRAEEAGLVLVIAAARDDRREPLDRLRASTIAWSRSRSTTGTSRRRRNSVASCVAIRPAPTMPTSGLARLGVEVGLALRAPLDEVESVEGRLRLRPGQELGDRLLLRGGSPPRSSSRAAPSIRSSASSGAGDAPWTASSTWPRGAAHDVSSSDQVGLGALRRPVRELERERDRLVHELDRVEQPVGEAELDRAFARQQPVLAQRVQDDDLTALSAPTRRGRAACRPSAGKMPRKTSGKPKWRTAVEIVRCRAVERELEAAAEAGAVDRSDGRERQRADPAESS